MKRLFFQLLLAVLATLTLAIPRRDQQVPLGKAIEQGGTVHHPRPQGPPMRTPFVIKRPTPPVFDSVVEGTKSEMPKSIWTATAVTPLPPGSTTSAWDWFMSAFKKETATAPHSCFCAGVSVCCHTTQGLSCNYGVCGI
ncbi:hypothetical protein CONLIGDRAFT_649160 [Coniochaeta ligniaria NRRL 30616]|uniref:Hydrophobin n=1 Tax=Coniochaeta ligniaria NRRL 30616 TaxID=1408157 RepID=A0A1J7I8P5_9PEZI|nr:hypothetical protein CONLIGDRAFT_649160 [Coniochaeta ligniaria NRRL 30616]